MRVIAHLLLLALLSGPAWSQDDDSKLWTLRDLDPPVLVRVLEDLPEKRREEITSMKLDRAQSALLREQKTSQWRCPWKKRDLPPELVTIFEKHDADARRRLMNEVPLADAIVQLQRANAEDLGTASALKVRVKLDEPEVRNAGTANARIMVRGSLEGVKPDDRIRIHADLKYPNRDSRELVTRSGVASGSRFSFEMKLPRKKLLLGRYYLTVRLDFNRSKDPDYYKVGGMFVTASASRIVYVGIDGARYRNFPDEAPEVLDQDIDIRLFYRSLIRSRLIRDIKEEDEEKYPDDAPGAPYYAEIDRRTQALWQKHAEAGVVPIEQLYRELEAKVMELEEVWDEPTWRHFLDTQYYPKLDAMEDLLGQYDRDRLCLRYPELQQVFLDHQGLLNMMREHAARRSRYLYEANDVEFPRTDDQHIRTTGMNYTYSAGMIRKSLNLLRRPKRGITEEEILDMFVLMQERRE
jgi:hypothetical protein